MTPPGSPLLVAKVGSKRLPTVLFEGFYYSDWVVKYVTYLTAAGPRGGPNPLFLCDGRATTAQRASERVTSLSAGLTHRAGLQVGDRACIAALATDHGLEALLATTAVGGIAAPLNWRWGAEEAAYALGLVGARVLLADAACLPWALRMLQAAYAGAGAGAGAGTAAAGSSCSVATVVLLGSPASYARADLARLERLAGSSSTGTAAAAAAAASSAPDGAAAAKLPPRFKCVFAEAMIRRCPSTSMGLSVAPGGAALIVFTSGTTGRPKGVTLTHAALHAQSMAKLLVCGYSAADVYLHAAPLFHIGGISSALAMLLAGARHVFLPRFDAARALRTIQECQVTSFIAVPAMAADLCSAAAAAGVGSLPGVTRILVGGGGMPPPLQARLAALCPAAVVDTAYGMTEAASSMTFLRLWGPSGQPGSASVGGGATAAAAVSSGGDADVPAGGVLVGQAPPGIELAIFLPAGKGGAGSSASASGSGGDGHGGCLLREGEGEVVTRGPHVMSGYWGDAAATAAALLPGGWLRTGDLGCLQQGWLWLLGRAKDMIKSGGENVHAWEVERALMLHPAVAAVAAVAVPDWRLGEAVAAVVVLQAGWSWEGPACQVLLRREQVPATHSQAAAGALLDAAAAAAAAPSSATASASAGSGATSDARVVAVGRGGVEEEEEEGGEDGAADSSVRCSGTDGEGAPLGARLQRVLLQAPQQQGRGSSPSAFGSGLAGLAALSLTRPQVQEQEEQHQHQDRGGSELAAACEVAAGLRHLAASLAAAPSPASAEEAGAGAAGSGGGSGPGGSSGSGGGGQTIDGLGLQAHCRGVGLAGFKLPRVFLLSTTAALPTNSTGKVLKHLVRQQVLASMEGAAASSGARSSIGGSQPGGSRLRSRL